MVEVELIIDNGGLLATLPTPNYTHILLFYTELVMYV